MRNFKHSNGYFVWIKQVAIVFAALFALASAGLVPAPALLAAPAPVRGNVILTIEEFV